MKNTDLKKLAELFQKRGITMTEDQIHELSKQLEKDFQYEPTIGIFGQTGAGKSSLINAMFGNDICAVSAVEACTRDPQSVNISGMNIVDFPGIGECKLRDEEYRELYKNWIPKLDAIIWVLQGATRSYRQDLDFYETIKDDFVFEDGTKAPLVFVVNQVDNEAPKDWNKEKHEPGPGQLVTIEQRKNYVAGEFGIPSNLVFPVSAIEGYNIIKLTSYLLSVLPATKGTILASRINEAFEKDEKKKHEVEEMLKEQLKRQEEYYEKLIQKIQLEKEEREEKEEDSSKSKQTEKAGTDYADVILDLIIVGGTVIPHPAAKTAAIIAGGVKAKREYDKRKGGNG